MSLISIFRSSKEFLASKKSQSDSNKIPSTIRIYTKEFSDLQNIQDVELFEISSGSKIKIPQKISKFCWINNHQKEEKETKFSRQKPKWKNWANIQHRVLFIQIHIKNNGTFYEGKSFGQGFHNAKNISPFNISYDFTMILDNFAEKKSKKYDLTIMATLHLTSESKKQRQSTVL